MTRVAVHQPNYFPWLGYFHKLSSVDVCVLLDNVDFQQGNASSLTNRTSIRSDHGLQKITVPVLKASPSRLLKDVRIDHRQPWKRKHLGSLTAAYGKAAAFKSVFPWVAATIDQAGESLAELNQDSIVRVCRFLGIKTPLLLASSLNLTATEKTERLIEISARVGASTYVSGQGARKYNDEALFRSHGIALEYSVFVCTPYPQLQVGFMANLSVLDALFNCGLETLALLRPGEPTR